jgi:uncharacterized protein
MWDPQLLAIVAAVFLIAGLVKGLVGMGLPTVALALLALTIDLKEAIPLMLVPSFASNLVQALTGRALKEILLRLWPLLAAVVVATWFGGALLVDLDAKLLSGLFGLLLAAYALVSLATPQVPAPGRHEAWLSPLVGATTGLVTGLTGSFVFPSVLYMQALGWSRDVLIQAMGITFIVATLALSVALAGHGLLSAEVGLGSFIALIPALAGMFLGQRLRRRFSEQRFRQIFFLALVALGIYLAGAAAMSFAY